MTGFPRTFLMVATWDTRAGAIAGGVRGVPEPEACELRAENSSILLVPLPPVSSSLVEPAARGKGFALPDGRKADEVDQVTGPVGPEGWVLGAGRASSALMFFRFRGIVMDSVEGGRSLYDREFVQKRFSENFSRLTKERSVVWST